MWKWATVKTGGSAEFIAQPLFTHLAAEWLGKEEGNDND